MCKGCLQCPVFQQLLQSCCVCHNPKLNVSCMAGEFLACTHTHTCGRVFGVLNLLGQYSIWSGLTAFIGLISMSAAKFGSCKSAEVLLLQNFEWGPVSLSFYVRLVLVKPTGSVKIYAINRILCFIERIKSTTSCVIPMSKGSHDSVHSIFLICSFLFRPCNFAAALYCCLPCR